MDDKKIAQTIKNAGGRLYLVGGAVRDEIMKREAHDKDYCVVGLDLGEFIKLFPKARIIGNDFPVFLMEGFEFALARTEKKVSQGYKGFEIYTSKDIKIEEDLKRRDITINAMAKDVLTSKIIDPFNAKEDIINRKIRHVSKSFSEDPLRVYRVARFAAKYNFDVDKDTIKYMNMLKNELFSITSDRIFLELRKALSTDTPSKFFETLKQANVLDVHFKEINDLIGVIQPEKYHPEGDVFNHTMIVLDKVSKYTQDESVRFAALVHDLGKAKTPKEMLPRHIGHDTAGEALVRDISNRITLPKKWKQKGKEVAKYHMIAANYKKMRPYKQAIFFNQISKSKIGLQDLEIIVNADDMLNRPKVEFAKLANEVLKKVNGDTLRKEGITFEKYGKDMFIHKLLEKQAKLIKEKESIK